MHGNLLLLAGMHKKTPATHKTCTHSSSLLMGFNITEVEQACPNISVGHLVLHLQMTQSQGVLQVAQCSPVPLQQSLRGFIAAIALVC